MDLWGQVTGLWHLETQQKSGVRVYQRICICIPFFINESDLSTSISYVIFVLVTGVVGGVVQEDMQLPGIQTLDSDESFEILQELITPYKPC